MTAAKAPRRMLDEHVNCGRAPAGFGAQRENRPAARSDVASSTRLANARRPRDEKRWRRRESNPGPKVLQSGPYVRLRRIWSRARPCPPAGPAERQPLL